MGITNWKLQVYIVDVSVSIRALSLLQSATVIWGSPIENCECTLLTYLWARVRGNCREYCRIWASQPTCEHTRTSPLHTGLGHIYFYVGYGYYLFFYLQKQCCESGMIFSDPYLGPNFHLVLDPVSHPVSDPTWIFSNIRNMKKKFKLSTFA